MEKDRTLLDKDGTPTIEGMKEYFQEHDYTTAPPPVDYEKLTPPQRKLMKKANEAFEKIFLINMKKMGGRGSFIDFSEDYPIRQLAQVDAKLVAGAVVRIMEDEELYKRVISSFFEAMQEPIMKALEEYAAANGKQVDLLTEEEFMVVVGKVADTADCRMIHLMMLTQSVPEIMEIIMNNKTHEDFNENVVENFPKMDHIRRWTHSDTKVGATLSLDEHVETGEYLNKIDMTQITFKELLASLDDTDREIILLRKEGIKLQEIADRVGYKTHSAVSKRLEAIKRKFDEYVM